MKARKLSNKAVVTPPTYTNHAIPTALAAAINKALRGATQLPYRYLLATTLMGTGSLAYAQGFEASIDLSNLDGNNGFLITGSNHPTEFSGNSVSGAGDVNGDGIPDLIIGSSVANADGRIRAGRSYVLFGGAGVGNSGSLVIPNVDGSDGFLINGDDAGDASGLSVSAAGDFNGDGVDDLIIGAPAADPNGVQRAGESYLVFGGVGLGSSGTLELSDLDGHTGFVIKGVASSNGRGNTFGAVVSDVGDINGDGLADLLVSSPSAYDNFVYLRGESYVVFGNAAVRNGRTLNLSQINGNNGFKIEGVDRNDESGTSIDGAGDVNGDGFDDLIIGAPGGNRNAMIGFSDENGESYVVFGGADVGSTGLLRPLDLDGSNGFTIFGSTEQVQSGSSVSGAGDFNGDGVDDLIIGGTGGRSSLGIDADNPRFGGESYVVFGGSDVGSSGSFDLDSSSLDGSTGFALFGSNDSEETVYSVSGAGDVNGDGIADVIIGASDRYSGASASRLSYVVFGGMEVGRSGSLQASSLDGRNGFVVNDVVLNDGFFRTAVSDIGDFNSDGIDDVIILHRANNFSGESYVIFGNADTSEPVAPTAPTFDLSKCTIIGTDGPEVLTGTTGPDIICGLGGNDRIRALGGADIIYGGAGDDFVSAGGGADTVFGENGRDMLVGGSGDDLLIGGELADQLFGGKGDDTLLGGTGADRLFGAAGNDRLFGQRGGDALFSGAGNDFLDGGPFNDTCTETSGVNTLKNC